MKILARFTLSSLFAVLTASAQPAFTSLHVFGDSASSTTDSPGAPYYYGNRYSNGRMWVELLAQWNGLSFYSTNNLSFWGHYSPILVSNVKNHIPPADVSTALYVVWVGNADFVDNIYNLDPYTTNNIAAWNNANTLSINNHFTVVTNLYSKGVRSLIMPNAVDLTLTPTEDWQGLTSSDRAFIRHRVIEFNRAFDLMVSNAVTSLPGLTVWTADIFEVFDQVLASPTNYGMINPGLGALFDDSLADKSLNGPGAQYVFWDDIHPTARFQMLVAQAVQESLSPVRLNSITGLNGTNHLNAVNIPVGRSGEVLGSTNIAGWSVLQLFDSTNMTQTISVPASGPVQFYRLRFPFNWTWP